MATCTWRSLPLHFKVRIKAGIALSQLRLFYGNPDGCLITVPEAFQTFLKASEPKSDGILSVDLEPERFHGHNIIGFRAKPNVPMPIPLWKHESPPNPWEYWDFVIPGRSKRLSLQKGLFYILKSKEKLALPPGVAVYCRASDESFGEMRIHYAGFAHPMFGRNRHDNQIGTPLIFEVRGHDVNVSLGDGESMARLQFYRMSKDACAGDEKTDYENQTLKLSGFFPDWPPEVDLEDNGEVHPADARGSLK